MTIIRDLSLDPQERMQRRVSNLEQGHIANQQSGAWVKYLQGAETANVTETGAYVNGMFFSVPTYGQYSLHTVVDGAASASGFLQIYMQIGAGSSLATYASPNQRNALTSIWSGFIEAGVPVGTKLARIAGTGSVVVYGGALTIHKIA